MSEAVVGSIDQIILAGVQLFVALIENLPTIIVEIVKAIPQIIQAVIDAFVSYYSKMPEIGLNLIMGVKDGILNAAGAVINAATETMGKIVDGVKGFLGIKSPSTVFAEIGDNMAQGVGVGFSGEMGDVSSDMAAAIGGAGQITAQEAINAINQGIISNISQLDQAVNAIVEKVLSAIAAQSSKLVNQGVDMAKQLATGMENGVTNITAKVPGMVTTIINAFIAQHSKFVAQGVELDKQLAAGMVNGIPQNTAVVPQITTAIINAYIAQHSKFVAQGIELDKQLAAGMVNGIPQITAEIPKITTAIINALKESIKDFTQVGHDNLFLGV